MFSGRRNAFFRVTPGEGELCAFAVKRGDIIKRLDVHANHPKFQIEFQRLSDKYEVLPLKNFAISIFSGITPKSGGDAYTNDGTGVLFIKSGCLSMDGALNIDEASKIKPTVHEKLMHSSQLNKNDVLIAIVGATIGKVSLFTEDRPANINQAIAAVRLDEKRLLPQFLTAYLLSPVGQTYLEFLKRPVARANINLEEIGEIGIPNLSLENQKKFADDFYAMRNAKTDKLSQANKLLRGTSLHVLKNMLGISFDISDGQYTYATKYVDIENRLDADYYSPQFVHFRRQIEESEYSVYCIGDISESIVTGFAAGKQDQADEMSDERRVPHLRPFSITPEGELSFETQKYVPIDNLKEDDYCKKNEVIFNNTNSPDLVGKTTVFDADVLCAVSNHMTRITVKDGINPYYISAFFNVLLSIGYWKLLCTNFNNQAGVNIDTLKSVRIPLPEKSVQDEIATEIMQRRRKANTLRREAEAEWKKAKEEFENELLKG